MHPILDTIRDHAAMGPQRFAAADPAAQFKYAALIATVDRLAAHIAAAPASTHVGILAPTSAISAAAHLACWRAGRTPVPLNYLLAPDVLAQIVADAELKLLLATEHFAEAANKLSCATLSLETAAGTTPDCAAPDAPHVSSDDLAVLLYTSGTSGAPKGVRLTFDNLVQNVRASVAHLRLDPDQRFVGLLPQFHSFGLTMTTLLPLMLGASIVYLPRFSPVALMNIVQEHKITILIAVASMYGALLKLRNIAPDALASLRLAISGGEPLPANTAAAFQQRFGIDILEGWGLTETSPVVSVNTPWAHRPGSVGRPIPGAEVWAVDEQHHRRAPDLEGELLVRGHCVMAGYHKRASDTAATMHAGGLLTGDIGRVDADGYIWITGRAKEMIIVGGENVFPRAIEEVLLEHPAVAEAAVVGVPDKLRGEVPIAFVVLREGARCEPRELREHCKRRLAAYMAPREIHIADDLPRGPTGKILKRTLPALAAEQR